MDIRNVEAARPEHLSSPSPTHARMYYRRIGWDVVVLYGSNSVQEKPNRFRTPFAFPYPWHGYQVPKLNESWPGDERGVRHLLQGAKLKQVEEEAPLPEGEGAFTAANTSTIHILAHISNERDDDDDESRSARGTPPSTDKTARKEFQENVVGVLRQRPSALPLRLAPCAT